MKNGRSPGPGNTNLELTDYGGRKVSALVTKLLNKILQGDNIPQGIKTQYLIRIYKEIKGSVRIRHQHHKSIYKDPG
jgi:hypothetical protein